MDTVVKICNAILVLKVPNEEGRKLDFRTKIDDIEVAALNTNNNFKGNKVIKIIDIQEKKIIIKIKTNLPKEKTITTRDLSYFSKQLYHYKNWKEYTRELTKLFTSETFEEIEGVSEQDIKAFDDLPLLPDSLAEQKIKAKDNLITDEKAIEAFKLLINMRDLCNGETKDRRTSAIEEIKKILVRELN